MTSTKTRQSDRLTVGDVSDLLGTAAYGGIDYWATAMYSDLEDGSETPARTVPAETVACTVHLYDGDPMVVPFGALLNAWDALTAADQPHVNDTIHGYFLGAVEDPDEVELGCIDAWAADVLVQLAAFGEVIYG